MKQVFLKVLSYLKQFFLSLKIHLHVGFYREDDFSKDKNEKNERDSDS